MNKELKGILRGAKKGITIRDDVWEAYIDLPSPGVSIAVYRTNKDEAIKIRQIILDALHVYWKEEDPEAWREEYRKKHAAGGKFEIHDKGGWVPYACGFFTVWPREDYREVPQPKPAKLTARIVRKSMLDKALFQSFEFAGTPEEYRVECERYGYAVVSEIKEVVEKPKTVTHYFALVVGRQQNSENKVFTVCGLDKEQLKNSLVGCSVIGDIEEREVEV